ncbi:hypothetical protein ALC60_08117 [Trachymyrmex zeteki]|uniref:Uncharacterized protein n=1 Tax=Mycetomoellerius zeteki TaxID=64791 RepID=A0A151WXQ9_9HYME|nr:hypothetical protein ALC60_08117 [Trachymyrmex zeteki]
MICVPRITIQSKRLWGVVKTGTVDCARLESRGETPRKLALRRYVGLLTKPKIIRERVTTRTTNGIQGISRKCIARHRN